MIKIFFSIFFLLYCIVAHSMVDMVKQEDEYLPESIRLGNFDRVDIICIPSEVESVMQVDQVILENSYFYKISIRQIRLTPYWSELINALDKTRTNKTYKLKDLRYAILFYHKNRKVISIYYDKSGNYGAINSIPVKFKGGVYEWIDKNFLKIVK